MSEERVMILRMLAEGKITPEEAEQLLDALDVSTAFQAADEQGSAAAGAATEPSAGTSGEASGEASAGAEKESRRRDVDFDADALAETIRDAVVDGFKGMKEGLSAGLGVLNDGVLRGLHEGLRGGLRGLAAARRAGTHVHDHLEHGRLDFGVFFGGGPSRQVDLTESIPAEGVASVSVSTASGDIRVQAWEEPTIKVRARGGVRGRSDGEAEEKAQRAAIRWRREGDRLAVTTGVAAEEPYESWTSSMDYDIYLPSTCGVSLNTKSGDVTVAGVVGPIEARSMSGDVRATGVGNSAIDLKSVSGDVDVRGGVRGGGEFIARSVSGDIGVELEGVTGGTYELATTSGDVTFGLGGAPELRANLSTISGDFRVDLEGARVSQRSRSQMVVETGAGSTKVTARTTSGDIALRARSAR